MFAHVGAHDVHRGRGAPVLEERQGILEFAELFPGQNAQLLELAAVVIAAVGLVHAIERGLDLGHGFGVGLQVGTFAGQEVAALSRFGVADQRDELAQSLLAQLRVMYALIGGIEPRLSCGREKKQTDQESDQ